MFSRLLIMPLQRRLFVFKMQNKWITSQWSNSRYYIDASFLLIERIGLVNKVSVRHWV